MLERNCINVQTLDHISHFKNENRLAVQMILEIFLTV